MSKEVDFYFDFASPNAYLSHKVMQSIKERTGASVNYIPVLLGGIFKLTNNKPPMEQFFGVKNKNEYQKYRDATLYRETRLTKVSDESTFSCN